MRIILLVILMLFTACTGRDGRFDLTKPVHLDMRPPEGPKNYQLGWQDGCESGLASTSEKIHLFLANHTYTLHPNLRYDTLYFKAWQYGYNHCAYSMKAMSQYAFL